MSRHIGKRVSYECGWCKKQFTLNKQSVDDSEKSGEVFCSKRCSEQFYLFALNPKNKTTDGMSGIACGDVGVSQVDEAGTVLGRSLRS